MIGRFSPNLKPLEYGTCPTCLKIAGEILILLGGVEALVLLGCVLKRLKILMKFNSAGPEGKNGPKIDRPLFPKFEAP